MNIKLNFDYYSRIIYVPDGYLSDIKDIHSSFFDWLWQQPDCVVDTPGGQLGFSYNEEDFLRYLNDVILQNSKEKAYLFNKLKKRIKTKYVLNF